MTDEDKIGPEQPKLYWYNLCVFCWKPVKKAYIRNGQEQNGRPRDERSYKGRPLCHKCYRKRLGRGHK